MPRETLVIQH